MEAKTLTLASDAWRLFAPPPKLTVSEWADRYRRLSPESSAEPGKWDTSRAEYQRGIMDAVTDPSVHTVVVMSSAQVGKTEIINTVCAYYIDQDPAPILVVQPTLEMGQAWSKDRLAPMIRDCPKLHDKVHEVKSRVVGNTMLHKKFPGGHITICGANSPASLASRPIRIVLCDEVDRYPSSAGTEGDPVALARKRSATFWNRKIILTSTPTLKGSSRIESAYEGSDQRRFYVECPHCRKDQVMAWKQVKWPEGQPGKAVYHCSVCGAEWTESDRLKAVRAGHWMPTAEGASGVAGFHLNELYSPWVTPADMAQSFIEAKQDREQLKTWINTALGETWEERYDSRAEGQVRGLITDMEAGQVPDDALALVAGADTQDNGFWFSVWAFGRDIGPHLVLDGFVPDLDSLASRTIGAQYGGCIVSRLLIDAMGHRTAEVYDFARKNPAVMPVKGEQQISGRPWANSVVDTIRGRDGKQYPVPGGLNLTRVDTTHFKNMLAGKMSAEPGEPGRMSLNRDASDDLVSHFCSEYQDEKGRWQCPKSKPNHLWDCAVYALAGAEIIGVRYFAGRVASAQRASQSRKLTIIRRGQ